MAPKTLVVPLDGSEVAERALSVAEALAERLGGSLLLVSAQFYGPLEPQEYLEECALPFQRAAVEVLATKQSHIAETVLDAIAGDESPGRVHDDAWSRSRPVGRAGQRGRGSRPPRRTTDAARRPALPAGFPHAIHALARILGR
jgi:nucleotide-binding universal stress UspA family protein